ncbi:MAG TPA: glycosyltransferase family 2 protein [Candidatus Korarchaeota archaeon]|nr:glycosyltransferase family 2 protein [Candidatus Korarchaeota archaeon]
MNPVVMLSGITNVTMALISAYMIFSFLRVLKGYRKLPTPDLRCNKRISVIIPARNEEGRISSAIRSVLKQIGPRDELIVVDDGSTDETFEEALASCNERCAIIKLLYKPEGWTGKSWACYHGYLHSNGDVLIFLDADTVLHGGLREACSLLEKYDAVSQLPRIRCDSLACGAVEIAFTSLLRLTYPYWDMSPGKAWLAGAFMGWKRESYEAVGTHKAVKESLVEDASLGRLASHMGLRITFFKGKFAESKWISKWGEAVNTLARIFKAGAPRSIYAYLLMGIFTYISALVYASPLLGLVGLANPLLSLLFMISIYGYASLSFIEVRASPISLVLAPVGLVLMGVALVKASRGSDIEWKGREARES